MARFKVLQARPLNFQHQHGFSFERVFEIIDLPHDIVEKKDAIVLHECTRRT